MFCYALSDWDNGLVVNVHKYLHFLQYKVTILTTYNE